MTVFQRFEGPAKTLTCVLFLFLVFVLIFFLFLCFTLSCQGLGYGMILSAYMNDKTTFDGLWAFAKYTLDSNGLPNWRTSKTGDIWGTGSASDADLDVGFGLVLAAHTFDPGNAGSSYLASARTHLAAVMAHDMDASTMLLKPGDGWETDM
jgi:endoglucanase